jgi:hypothetical protein
MQKQATHLLCLCASLLLYAPTAQAQDKHDSLTRYKWEIGTDLLWLIDKNTLPPTSIFVRRHTEKGAWRLRVGYNYQNNERRLFDTLDLYQTEQHEVLFRMGYEQKRNQKKFQLFYGTDIHLGYVYQKQDDYYDTDTNPGIDSRTFGNRKTLGIGLVTFIGLKYHIHPQVSVFGRIYTFSTIQ